MAVPIYFAREIEKFGKSIVCHATARSPIGVLTREIDELAKDISTTEYPIKKGYKLVSFYQKERNTYLYSMNHYDLVFVLTDSKEIPKGAIKTLSSLMSIYKNYNTTYTFIDKVVDNFSKVKTIRMKGDSVLCEYAGVKYLFSMNALCSGKPVVSFDTTLTQTDLLEKSGKTSSNGSTATTTEKKVATTATTESEGDEEDEDDVVSRLNDLIYDYEELEIQSDSDLAQVTSIEGEIEDLLAKLKTKDNQKFYRKVYEQAKGEVQTKINQYKSSLGNSSTQMPTDQTTSSSTTESTESDSSAGSGTDNSTDGSDDNEELSRS